MAEVYFKLVVAGRRTCDSTNAEVQQVPATMKDAVLALLTKRGYDANGQRCVR